VFDGYVLAFDIAGFVQTLAERGNERGERLRRPSDEEPDHRHRRLLRARRQRPRGRTAEKREELAAHHSITSSAARFHGAAGGTARTAVAAAQPVPSPSQWQGNV